MNWIRNTAVGSLTALVLGIVLWAAAAVQQRQGSQHDWESRALQFVQLLHEGRWSEARAWFDPRMAEFFVGNKLAETWQGLLSQVGSFEATESVSRRQQGAFQVVDVTTKFTNARINVRVVFDAEGRVSGLWFLPVEPPPYEAPEYVDQDAFKEVEVMFGKDPWTLPGTLAIPQGAGPFPAVVLVHGSGPNDRDETIGPNRPFRDLAWGLASKGIAVLRYDKRTKVYGQKMKGHEITVENEVIVDALAAIEFLRGREEVDTSMVFLLGHSLGATLAPEIAWRDGRLAGVIMLAAIARPLEEVMLEQINYIASLKEQSATEQAQLDTLRAKLARLQEDQLSPAETIMGVPAGYFYDMRRRDPVEFARKLMTPMLILQGGRDYQATPEDFRLWEKALGQRSNVTLKLYPDLNHLFFSGKGKATPEEYLHPGHVHGRLIRDIAEWIVKISKSR